MVTITDITPTRSNMSFGPSWQDVTGRMLSLASSDDGTLVFAGSLSSGLWVSGDGGEFWEQLTWAQPAPDQFGVPGALGGCCIPSIAVSPDSARWLVEQDPRVLADITGNGRADIVGFGDTGVWTALSDGTGGFDPAQFVVADFGIQAGGWRVDRHPRLLADITGDGRADIVGFGDAGVWTALSNGDGTFQTPAFVLANFGFEAGGWQVDKHPRSLADLTGGGRTDIVGFGDAGVWTALSNGDGTFQDARFVLANFGTDAGGWQVDKHPRFLADLTGNGRADIVGFGDAGVWTALGNGDGTFQEARFVLANFGIEAGGWQVDKHPRVLADLTGNGHADIVGFGDAGVWTALGNGDGTFQDARFVLANFGIEAGGWQVDKHPRFLADLTGNGRADIVGFGNAGVWTALGNGDGTFQDAKFVLADFGFEAGGWQVDKHPRVLADITGDGRADIVGFGDAGVYVAASNGDGAFGESARFVLSNFGHALTILAITQSDREIEDAGMWRSSDGGTSWSIVHAFPRSGANPPAAGQLVWAQGAAHLVLAAGQNSLAISRDAGATWQTAPVPANHVAVAAVPAGETRPPGGLRLGQQHDLGLARWRRSMAARHRRFAEPDRRRSWPLQLAERERHGRLAALALRGVCHPRCEPEPEPAAVVARRFQRFRSDEASIWQELPIPAVGRTVLGNVCLAATRSGQGEALFYGPQRSMGIMSARPGSRRLIPGPRRIGTSWTRSDSRRPAWACSYRRISMPTSSAAATSDGGHRLDAERRRRRSAAPTAERPFMLGRQHQLALDGELRRGGDRRTRSSAVAQYRRQRRLRLARRRASLALAAIRRRRQRHFVVAIRCGRNRC